MNAIDDPASKALRNMQDILGRQKAAQIEAGPVSAETRIDRIDRALSQLVKYQDQLVQALNADFGHRSSHHSQMMDIAAGIAPLQHARKHLRKWMRAEKRKTMFPLNLLGGRSRIEYQPLGVVGIISPWNFPVNLTFGPLANILGAGNRAMIKPSEYTPATSEIMKIMIEESFDAEEVAVIIGGPEVGQAFSSLAFDHLVFTGATSIARHVMSAAAQNLVPLTLELGGKSPVLVGEGADIDLGCKRIMFGKTANAGQICLAPDYLLVPAGQQEAIVEGLQKATSEMFPSLLDNPDYSSIINARHHERLQNYLDDARAKGARIVEINPAGETFEGQPHHKMPPTLILDTNEDMLVMQEEIFGPLLPIVSYDKYPEAIAYVNSKPRPLALYYFGNDGEQERAALERTVSGGVTINDVIMHVAQEELPFGGVGPSGMGAYHGVDGFKAFSHAKAVYRQSTKDIAAMIGMRPPFGKKAEKTIQTMIKS